MKARIVASAVMVVLMSWGAMQPAQARAVSGEELKKLSGVYRAIWKEKHKARVQLNPDGTLVARSGTRVDTGRWKVRGNELCVSFNVWTHGKFKCGKVEKKGEWYVGLRKKDGTPRLRFRR